jgi:hypothetical protein
MHSSLYFFHETSTAYIVKNMTTARQQLSENVPERYAVNNWGTSFARWQFIKQIQIIGSC